MSVHLHYWKSFYIRRERGGPIVYRGWKCARCGEPGYGVPR